MPVAVRPDAVRLVPLAEGARWRRRSPRTFRRDHFLLAVQVDHRSPDDDAVQVEVAVDGGTVPDVGDAVALAAVGAVVAVD